MRRKSGKMDLDTLRKELVRDEEWRPIDGFPRHEISNCGRVRTKNGILKLQSRKPHGYIVQVDAQLWFSGRNHIRKIHRLVLAAFVGPCPPGMEGCHNDGNPLNNHISNLRWDTHSANQRDMVLHGRAGRATYRYGEHHHGAKLTWDAVRIIRAEAVGPSTQRALAKRFGVTPATITQIVKRRTWIETPS